MCTYFAHSGYMILCFTTACYYSFIVGLAISEWLKKTMYLLQHFNIVPIQNAFHELNIFINSKKGHMKPLSLQFQCTWWCQTCCPVILEQHKTIVLLPLTLFAWLISVWPQMLPGGVQFGLAGGLKSIFRVTLKPKICFPLPLLCFRRAKMAFAFRWCLCSGDALVQREIQTMQAARLRSCSVDL